MPHALSWSSQDFTFGTAITGSNPTNARNFKVARTHWSADDALGSPS